MGDCVGLWRLKYFHVQRISNVYPTSVYDVVSTYIHRQLFDGLRHAAQIIYIYISTSYWTYSYFIHIYTLVPQTKVKTPNQKYYPRKLILVLMLLLSATSVFSKLEVAKTGKANISPIHVRLKLIECALFAGITLYQYSLRLWSSQRLQYNMGYLKIYLTTQQCLSLTKCYHNVWYKC